MCSHFFILYRWDDSNHCFSLFGDRLLSFSDVVKILNIFSFLPFGGSYWVLYDLDIGHEYVLDENNEKFVKSLFGVSL